MAIGAGRRDPQATPFAQASGPRHQCASGWADLDYDLAWCVRTKAADKRCRQGLRALPAELCDRRKDSVLRLGARRHRCGIVMQQHRRRLAVAYPYAHGCQKRCPRPILRCCAPLIVAGTVGRPIGGHFGRRLMRVRRLVPGGIHPDAHGCPERRPRAILWRGRHS